MDRSEVMRLAQEAGIEAEHICFRATQTSFERFASLVRNQAREESARLVRDDAWALTFQTFGQYRTAVLKALRALKTEEVHLTARPGLPSTAHELNCICGATWEIGSDGSEMLVAAPSRRQSGAKKQDHPESESGGSISAIGRDAKEDAA